MTEMSLIGLEMTMVFQGCYRMKWGITARRGKGVIR
jgi:hypothetical protein